MAECLGAYLKTVASAEMPRGCVTVSNTVVYDANFDAVVKECKGQ